MFLPGDVRRATCFDGNILLSINIAQKDLLPFLIYNRFFIVSWGQSAVEAGTCKTISFGSVEYLDGMRGTINRTWIHSVLGEISSQPFFQQM